MWTFNRTNCPFHYDFGVGGQIWMPQTPVLSYLTIAVVLFWNCFNKDWDVVSLSWIEVSSIFFTSSDPEKGEKRVVW
jgi:hypothetical protein